MTSNTDHSPEHTDKVLDTYRLTAKNYAAVHYGAYLEASDVVRKVIDDMAAIYADDQADADDRESALDTLTDALFPYMPKGELGLDVEDMKIIACDGSHVPSVVDQLADEEANFAACVATLMESKGMNQAQLAEAVGLGQPAVSMMLNRACRPQKRTIQKFAAALGVKPSDLWPGFEN